jgi:hypothetical protein
MLALGQQTSRSTLRERQIFSTKLKRPLEKRAVVLICQQVIEDLMRQLMHYDAEFQREDATSAVGSHAKH